MIPHNSNREYPSVASSDLVRKQWQSFEHWLNTGPKAAADKRRQELFSEIDKRCPGPARQRPEREAEKTVVKTHLKEQLVELARSEWSQRLGAAGLRAEDWIDITVQEAMAVERALGGPLADLTEDEYAAKWAATSTTSLPSNAPPRATASTSSLSSQPSTSSSTSYQVVSPTFFGYPDADDDDRSENLEALTMLATEYITSDEDPDVDTLAYAAWGATDISTDTRHRSQSSSSAEQLGAHVIQSLNSASQSSRKLEKSVTHTKQHSLKQPSTPRPEATPKTPLSNLRMTKARKAEEERRVADAQRRVDEQEKARLPDQRGREVEARSSKVLRSDAVSLTSAQVSDVFHIEQHHSTPHSRRVRAPSYIGPHQTSDPTDTVQEEADFERFKMDVRIDKIREFHEEAAQADIELARNIHNSRNTCGLTREGEAALIADHEEKMLSLRRTKEAERKQIVDDERMRRREIIRKRSTSSQDFYLHPSTPFSTQSSHSQSLLRNTVQKHPVPTPQLGISKEPSDQRYSLEPEWGRTIRASKRPAWLQSEKESEPHINPDLVQRFLDTQRVAQPVAISPIDPEIARQFKNSQLLAQAQQAIDPAPLDVDLAKRFMESQRAVQSVAEPSHIGADLARQFQESQRLAQALQGTATLPIDAERAKRFMETQRVVTRQSNSVVAASAPSREPSEAPVTSNAIEPRGLGNHGATPKAPTSAASKSRFWTPSSSLDDNSASLWAQPLSRDASASSSEDHDSFDSLPPIGITYHRSATSSKNNAKPLRHVTVEEVNDEDSWVRVKATPQASRSVPIRASAEPQSSITRLQTLSDDSPFLDPAEFSDVSDVRGGAFWNESASSSEPSYSRNMPGEFDVTSPEYWESLLRSDTPVRGVSNPGVHQTNAAANPSILTESKAANARPSAPPSKINATSTSISSAIPPPEAKPTEKKAEPAATPKPEPPQTNNNAKKKGRKGKGR